MFENHDNLLTECTNEIANFYKGGEGLKSTHLKNYTSGDGENSGMESLVETVIWKVIDHLEIDRSRVQVNQDYFQGENELDDPQRMDFHVWIDGKVPVVIESRAWIDKPFYQLKRAVVRNFMELDYVRQHLTEDPKFIFVALCIDVKDRLRETNNKTMGYGEHIHEVKLSPHRRGWQKGNYFDHGYSPEGVQDFVKTLLESFQPYMERR